MLVVVAPVFHEILPLQLLTVKVAVPPVQMVTLFTVGVGVGFGVTVTMLVAVPVHVPTPHVAV